jgi:release factor glutamine methyltransferase
LALNGNPATYAGRVTVLEIIQRSTDFLTRKGIDSPRLQSELLLAHVLRVPRMQLYLNFERELASAETDALRELIKRRGEHVPLQHIVGSTSFCGFEIEVDRRVLIPRPETELLAEKGWLFLNDISHGTPNKLSEETGVSVGPEQNLKKASALDFGTGSGCLAIALALKCPSASIVALDIDPQALEVARSNAGRHDVSERIDFILGDGLDGLAEHPAFDLIVANPPYIPSGEIPKLQPEVRDYDPRIALDGGADGLDFYRRLAREAGPVLKPNGKIMLEFGDAQEKPLTEMFTNENWIVEQLVSDYTQTPRILIARRMI